MNRPWYHVTSSEDLERIRVEGLHGRDLARKRNFMLVPTKGDAVHLWPEIGPAEAWSARDVVKDPVLLRVTGLEADCIWPDHEAAGHWMGFQGDIESEGGEIDPLAQRFLDAINEYDAAHGHEWASDVDHDFGDEDPYLASWDVVNFVPLEGMLKVLHTMDPQLRSQVAEHIAKIERSAVMHEGSIDVQQIEIAQFDPQVAQDIAGKPLSHDHWRGYLNEILGDESYDEMGRRLPDEHRWHHVDADALNSCYAWQALSLDIERPVIGSVEDEGERQLPSSNSSQPLGL